MLRGLAIVFAVLLATGCQKQEPAPRTLPKIPAGFESKPGTGGMDAQKAGKKQTATEQAKADTGKDDAAAGQDKAGTDKKAANPEKQADAAKTGTQPASGGTATGSDTKKK